MKKSPPSTAAQKDLLRRLGTDPLVLDGFTKFTAHKEIQRLLIRRRRLEASRRATPPTMPSETIDQVTAREMLDRVPVPHVLSFPLTREYKAAETRRTSPR